MFFNNTRMGSKYSLLLVVIITNFVTVFGASCSDPEVQVKTLFTTQDATILTNIAYIAEFGVQCQAGSVSNLYADIGANNLIPVSVIGPNSYQVSWTEEIKTARRGDIVIRIFDEDGYSAFRKALRTDEPTSSIPTLTSITLNHPGAFTGPWLKSEFLAAALSCVVAYLALSSRSKLLA